MDFGNSQSAIIPEQPQVVHVPDNKRRRQRGYKKTKKSATYELVGHPVVAPIRWDDLGLGMIRSFGFMPGRPIYLKMNKDKWSITGARANSSVVPFIVGGAGGFYYFFQDLIQRFHQWGDISYIIMAILPVIINSLVKTREIEFYPFELEFFGYDSKAQILILSTLTQPGGLVAMKIDMPADPHRRKIEEEKLIKNLSDMHAGFLRIDDMVKFDTNSLKTWSYQTLIWLLLTLGYLYNLRR
jgi:hypothetical protein